MTLQIAQNLARDVLSVLTPVCERAEVAGSVRRGSSECRDVELVVIPRSRDMALFKQIVDRWEKIRGEATGRYTQRRVAGQKVDLFIANKERWPCVFLIRTGSAEFSQAVVTHAHSVGMQFKDGRLCNVTDQGATLTPVSLAEERDVFDALGLRYVEPRDRIGKSEVVPA